MINRETFHKDPAQNPIINDGVADFADDASLRFELQTFVCEGEYETAINRILSSYLGNLDRNTQPSIWLSGFFGSGKSHVAKMLAALWVDHQFPDKATARAVVNLPTSTKELLAELTTRAKTHAPVHVSAGKLLGLDSDPATAVLGIILRSCGLPDTLHTASLCRWMIQEGIFDNVKQTLAEKGKPLTAIWPNMYVARELGEAISLHHPGLGKTSQDVLAALRAQFPRKTPLTIGDFRPTAQWALRHDKSYLLTAVILDEVQQYLGDDGDKIGGMQWVVECLSKEFNGRIVVIGTGQSAMTMELFGGKLNDRFTVKSILQETDVQRVVRRVVLEKAENAKIPIKTKLDDCSGEINRHLNGSRIAPKPADAAAFVPDYPLLPARQRLWSAVLRAYDPTETKGRVRGMLRVVYKSVLEVLDQPLGDVISADSIYDHISSELLQYHQISESVANNIAAYRSDANPNNRLKGSLLALTHLLHLLPRNGENDTGARATKDHLADLLVTDLPAGSADLRKRVDTALQELTESAELMFTGGEYHLQTTESREWEHTYQKQRSAVSKAEFISTERKKRLETLVENELDKLKVVQGSAKLNRPVEIGFGPKPFGDPDRQILVFVRNEWDESMTKILDEVRSRGDSSPFVTVVLPRESGEVLRDTIIRYLASAKTIELKGHTTTEETAKIRANFEGRRDTADKTIDDILAQDVLAKARVYLDGGDPIERLTLANSVQDACEQAAKRLFTKFRDADFTTSAWKQVLDRARKHDDKPLKPVSYEGDAATHPVCAAIHKFVADNSNKRGSAAVEHFARKPFGWEDDAIVAGLAVLVKDKHLRATGSGGVSLDVGMLDNDVCKSAAFAAETVTLTVAERLAIRGMFSSLAGINCKSEELESRASAFVLALLDCASHAGGDPPLPAKPNPPSLKAFQTMSGPELLREILKAKEALTSEVTEWKAHKDLAAIRLPRWQTLLRALKHSKSTEIAASVQKEADTIRDNRSLLADPDPVPKLVTALVDVIRPRLVGLHAKCQQAISNGNTSLNGEEAWQKLNEEQRTTLVARHRLTAVDAIEVGSDEHLLTTLDARGLEDWKNFLDAIPSRFAAALADAIRLMEPKIQIVHTTGGIVKTPEQLDEWLATLRGTIAPKLKDGPVQIN
jgi:hypothetical protein